MPNLKIVDFVSTPNTFQWALEKKNINLQFSTVFIYLLIY